MIDKEKLKKTLLSSIDSMIEKIPQDNYEGGFIHFNLITLNKEGDIMTFVNTELVELTDNEWEVEEIRVRNYGEGEE